MKTDRRGFLGALLVAPFAPRLAEAVAPIPGPFLTANVYGVGPPLTEAAFVAAVDAMFKPVYRPETFVAAVPWLEFDIPDDVEVVSETDADGNEWIRLS